MKCPNCDRIQRLTDRQKMKVKEQGSLEVPCYHCGTIIVHRLYDVDKKAKRMHCKENGICTNCCKRPAIAGLSYCEQCKSYQYDKKEETKSTGYYDLYYRGGIKNKEPNKELEKLSKEAYEKGLSYGELVAIKEGRMKKSKDLD